MIFAIVDEDDLFQFDIVKITNLSESRERTCSLLKMKKINNLLFEKLTGKSSIVPGGVFFLCASRSLLYTFLNKKKLRRKHRISIVTGY